MNRRALVGNRLQARGGEGGGRCHALDKKGGLWGRKEAAVRGQQKGTAKWQNGKKAKRHLQHVKRYVTAGPRIVRARLANLDVGETAILLHPPLHLVGVSIAMERGCQQNGGLADGCAHQLKAQRPRCAGELHLSRSAPIRSHSDRINFSQNRARCIAEPNGPALRGAPSRCAGWVSMVAIGMATERSGATRLKESSGGPQW